MKLLKQKGKVCRLLLTLVTTTFTLFWGTIAHAELDSNGWTVLTPSLDSRIIYVSSSVGSDANSGFSENSPVATIAKGKGLMRSGYPDWLLLKCGDEFVANGSIKKNGRSESEPLVFSSYGAGARPIVKGQGFYTYQSTNPEGFSFSNVSFTGIDFRGTAIAQTGITISGRASNILVEDCKFTGFTSSMNLTQVDTHLSNITIRRNVIADNDVQGLFIDGVDGLLVSENVIDNNGWGVGGYGGESGEPGPTIFKHNMYLRDITHLTVTNNITARGSYMGVKLAGNGFESFTDFTVENNLFYNNAFSMSSSTGSAPAIDQFRFDRGIIEGNIFTEVGRTFVGGGTSDLSVYSTNAQNVLFDNNYFVHKKTLSRGEMFNWGGLDRHLDITVKNSIVYNWETDHDETYYFKFYNEVYRPYPQTPGITNFQLINNEIDLPAASYVDPTRSVGSYYASIGGTNDAIAFLMAARNMSKANWNPALTAKAVNDYIKIGFKLKLTDEEEGPTVPVGLASSAIKDRSFNLSWTASTDNVALAGYDIYKNEILYASSSKNFISLTGLTPSTTYRIKVVAKDFSGKLSPPSTILSVKTLADTLAPSAPTSLKQVK